MGLAAGAAERLQLFQADLMAPGSFDDAVAGCDAVVHCASPFMGAWWWAGIERGRGGGRGN